MSKQTYTSTAADLYTGDRVGNATVLTADLLGDLVQIVWSLPDGEGDYVAREEFVVATRTYEVTIP